MSLPIHVRTESTHTSERSCTFSIGDDPHTYVHIQATLLLSLGYDIFVDLTYNILAHLEY